jgi:hypothetical protein
LDCTGKDLAQGPEIAMPMLEYATEYPDAVLPSSGGSCLSERTLVQGATLTKQDGKSDLVCGSAFPAGPAADPVDDCACV